MSTAVLNNRTSLVKNVKPLDAKAIEQVLIGGDLSALSEEQRLMYYNQVCESLSLNPLTKPFDYIKLNGKLTLYAKRDCRINCERTTRFPSP